MKVFNRKCGFLLFIINPPTGKLIKQQNLYRTYNPIPFLTLPFRTYKLTHVCVFTQIEINREFLVIKQLK